VELESLFSLVDTCFCKGFTKNRKEGYILCAEYKEDNEEIHESKW